MPSRSHLYSAQPSSPALLPEENPSCFLAPVSRGLLSRALSPAADWRFPLYRDWWSRHDLFELKARTRLGTLQGLRRLILSPFRTLAKTSYIEWRYYALLCPEYRGIIGVALVNPEGYFESLAEGGLLLILAGVAGGPGLSDAGEAADLCWMKLFPTATLKISEEAPACLEAVSDGISLRIEHQDPGAASILLSGPGAPQLSLRMRGLSSASLHPTWGEDLRRVPGAHWVVQTVMPMAEAQGSLRITRDCWPGAVLPLVDHPAIVSPPLARRLAAEPGGLDLSLDGNGYYEHAFGINPMPLHGWDFIYAPDVAGRRAVVLQSYARSSAMTYLDVLWEESGAQRYLRFPAESLSLRWEERVWHPEIRAEVPGARRITAVWDGYRIEIENRIGHRIALLRPQRFFVRHFFISEEMSRTSWVLKDAAGRLVSGADDVLSGGETARLRWRV